LNSMPTDAETEIKVNNKNGTRETATAVSAARSKRKHGNAAEVRHFRSKWRCFPQPILFFSYQAPAHRLASAKGYRLMAASISSLKVFLLRCLAKSEVAIIPTNTLFFVTGSRLILYLTIFLAASLIEDSSSIVIS